jgi:hypothetical protein
VIPGDKNRRRDKLSQDLYSIFESKTFRCKIARADYNIGVA